MYIEPNTNIRLLKNCPLDTTYNHTLYFATKAAQIEYFSGLAKYSFTNQSYQRVQKGTMRVQRKAEDLYDCNYLMFQNASFGDRWFYAFIQSVEYVNNITSEITFEIDVMQTWFFDFNLQETFVVREHVMSDEIGEHTVPEGLELGPYELANFVQGKTYNETSILLNATLGVDSSVTCPSATFIGGVPIAGGVWAYECNSTSEDYQAFLHTIKMYYENARGDSIANVYLVPSEILGYVNDNHLLQDWNAAITSTFTCDRKIPYKNECKNNKLYSFPYCYHALSNNNGSSNILKPEIFLNDTITFSTYGVPVPGGSIKCLPLDYGKLGPNEQESIMGGKFPMLSWSADNYTAWLTQNALNLGVGIIGGIVTAGVSAATGNVAGIVGGAGKVFSNVEQMYQHSLCPETSKGNTNGGDIQVADNKNGFFDYQYRIREEYRQIIDDYFTMYGYKVNTVKVPNISGRKRWNYVQTENITLTGSVPADDMNKICNIFNRGITFWKNGSEVGQYHLDNTL